jgi:hypothetical protein
MATMKVSKALVIGLGSTGTRICNQLAERLEWELGSLEAASFVKFLCIETDESEKSRLQSRGDFLPISLSKEDYTRIISNPAQYSEHLLAGDWADIPTLRKLSSGAVTKGAGNIRMVGRLTFLHKDCYDKVSRAVSKRVAQLSNDVDERSATQEQAVGADGEVRQIEFSPGTPVFVVGSLCGGTCSGLASDFGLFLQAALPESFTTSAIFSLPHNLLSDAVHSYSERYKVNAYHALTELNHYSAVDAADQTRRVAFPDGRHSKPGQSPYDMVFLAMPSGSDVKSEHELNEAIGDYLFLRIMAPDIDPGGRWVDVSQQSKNGIYPAFCTFGFSSLEYPARRIMEACSAKLLSTTLSKYRERTTESKLGLIDQGLTELGINWEPLQQVFLDSQSARNLQATLTNNEADLIKNLASSIDESRKSLYNIRNSFDRVGSDSVSGILAGARNEVVGTIKGKIRTVTSKWLLDFEVGPGPMLALADRAIAHLDALIAQSKDDDSKKKEAVDRLMSQVAEIHENGLIGLLRLRQKAIERLKLRLKTAIREEISSRLRSELLTQLKDPVSSTGVSEDGVVTQIRKELLAVRKRVDGLSYRLLELKNMHDKKWMDLAGTAPVINGKVLFDKGIGESDTVPRAYKESLEHERSTASESWQTVENRFGAAVIRSWDNLPDSVAPATALSPAQDWLYPNYTPTPESLPVPEGDLEKLLQAASRPFKRIASAPYGDVLTKWHEESQTDSERNSILRTTAESAMPLLKVDANILSSSHFSAVNTQTLILRSQSSQKSATFDQRMETIIENAKTVESPDVFRAVVITHSLGFPLTAVPALVQPGGLADAVCQDFATFHTRKDVKWTSLPKRATEQQSYAASVLAVAVLLKLIKLEDRKLIFKGTTRGLNEPEDVILTANMARAGAILERGGPDEKGNPTRGVLELLKARILEAQTNEVGDQVIKKNANFVNRLKAAIEERIGVNIEDYDSMSAYATAYCSDNTELRKALISTAEVEQSVIGTLLRREDDTLAKGQKATRDGLYCSKCGGWIAENVADARTSGWTCKENSQHYFGPVL